MESVPCVTTLKWSALVHAGDGMYVAHLVDSVSYIRTYIRSLSPFLVVLSPPTPSDS